MPRSKKISEAMRTAAREKILTASKDLFLEKGITSTSVKEIAQTAGVSNGLLYHYFRTKEEIFETLVKEAMLEQAQIGNFLMDGDTVSNLKNFIHTILDAVAENGEFIRVMNLFTNSFIGNIDFPGREDVTEGNDVFHKQVADFIKKGQTEGVFREGNPMAMAQLLLIMINGICSMKVDYKEKFVPPTQEMITSFILKEDA